MKKVLYITNIEVPYRIKYFNLLAQHCDLTVLYEKKKSSERNEEWTKSEKINFKTIYLKGLKMKGDFIFSLEIIKYIFKNYDNIIIGCYNSPTEILAIILLRLFRRKYILNLDGLSFVNEKNWKNKIKKFIIKGANKYLVAGEDTVNEIKEFIKNKEIIPYYFSSLTREEICKNAKEVNKNNNNIILVVGQYHEYKGLDIALEVASKDKDNGYRFVGTGNKSWLLEECIKKMELNNVEVVPFLSKEKLYEEYKNCNMLVLPSRQECWGLVINEAASFGTPIVTTDGSGAGIEFLQEKYPHFLAKRNDPEDLFIKVKALREYDKVNEYKQYLIKKSQEYFIEKNVEITMNLIR